MRPLAQITPVPLPTGFSHPSCYAAGLGGCSTKITGEHPISEGALKVWGGGNTVQLKGLSWMKGDSMHEIPTARLAAKILCSNHNRALSPLDALGKNWVAHLRTASEDLNSVTKPRPTTFLLVNGHDLERWLLKVLCGLIVSGSVDTQIADPRAWRPPREWLELIYGVRPFPAGLGLNFIGKPGEETPHTFAFAVISNPNDGVLGLMATFYGFRFLFAMTSGRDGLLSESVYRPAIVHTTNGIIDDNVLIRWAESNEGGTVEALIDIGSPEQYARVGRNDPCPCRNGKKYKLCHGR